MLHAIERTACAQVNAATLRMKTSSHLILWEHASITLLSQIVKDVTVNTQCADCSGEQICNNAWEPLCIKQKPAGTVWEKQMARNEKCVLEELQSALQEQEGPYHISYLLDSFPRRQPPLGGWAEHQQRVWFVTE